MSRFEEHLAREAGSDRGSPQSTIAELRLAAYRARRGDVDAAEGTVKSIRASGWAPTPAVFAYLNLVEAICLFFSRGAGAAQQKLERARAISLAIAGSDEIFCLVNSWLISVHRITGDWEKIPFIVMEIERSCRSDYDEALSRLGLGVADCLQELECYSAATKWYHFSREHAIKLGDDIALAAVLYNRAALHLFNMRIQELQDHDSGSGRRFVALEASSAENFSSFVAEKSMPWALDLLKGQIDMLEGRYAQASRWLRLDAQGLESGWRAVELVRRSDVLRCDAELQQASAAAVELEANELRLWFDEKVNDGDIAVAAYSLAMALRCVGSSAFEEYLTIARASRERYLRSIDFKRNLLLGGASAADLGVGLLEYN